MTDTAIIDATKLLSAPDADEAMAETAKNVIDNALDGRVDGNRGIVFFREMTATELHSVVTPELVKDTSDPDALLDALHAKRLEIKRQKKAPRKQVRVPEAEKVHLVQSTDIRRIREAFEKFGWEFRYHVPLFAVVRKEPDGSWLFIENDDIKDMKTKINDVCVAVFRKKNPETGEWEEGERAVKFSRSLIDEVMVERAKCNPYDPIAEFMAWIPDWEGRDRRSLLGAFRELRSGEGSRRSQRMGVQAVATCQLLLQLPTQVRSDPPVGHLERTARVRQERHRPQHHSRAVARRYPRPRIQSSIVRKRAG